MVTTKQSRTSLLLELIANVRTEEDMNRMNQLYEEVVKTATEDELHQIGSARRELSKRLLEESKQATQSTLAFLRAHGHELDLGDWLTIVNYAKKYGVDSHVVTNWIRRGVIPADCVVELPVFNNIRMVRDQAYR